MLLVRYLGAVTLFVGMGLAPACRSKDSGAAAPNDHPTSAGSGPATPASTSAGRRSDGSPDPAAVASAGGETDLSGYTPTKGSPRKYFLPWVSTRFRQECQRYQVVVWLPHRRADVGEVLAQTLRVYPELRVVSADPQDTRDLAMGIATTSQLGPDGTTPVMAQCAAPEACEHFVAILGHGGAQVALSCAGPPAEFVERYDSSWVGAAAVPPSAAGRCAWVSHCASRSRGRWLSCDIIAHGGIERCHAQSSCESVSECIGPYLPKRAQRAPLDPPERD